MCFHSRPKQSGRKLWSLSPITPELFGPLEVDWSRFARIVSFGWACVKAPPNTGRGQTNPSQDCPASQRDKVDQSKEVTQRKNNPIFKEQNSKDRKSYK